LAGHDISVYLQKLLVERGHNFTSAADFEIVKDVKEKMCLVVNDYAAAVKDAEETHACEKNYELPDGKKILIGSERFKAAEILFQPHLADGLINKDVEGVHRLTFDSINQCEPGVRRDLFENIILSGGSTLFDGMGERMWQEIDNQVRKNGEKEDVKILASPERKFSVWLGGSILASLSTFQTMWINKQEYEEVGPSIIHRKCF